MKLKKSYYIAITIVTVLVIMLGFIIYAAFKPSASLFYIHDVSFILGEQQRSVEFTVSVEKGSIEIKDLYVNDIVIREWSANKYKAYEGEEIKCYFDYNWKMGKEYRIKLFTTEGQYVELTAKSPQLKPSLNLNLGNINVITHNSGFTQIKAEFEAYGQGIDSLHMLLLTYLSFDNSSRNIYIFYDPEYMAEESIRRADVIISYFNSYGVPIYKIDYQALEILCLWAISSSRRCILIIINPLKDVLGRRIFDALPSPLLDPNGNGFLRDDSRYSKSFIYDMMADEGLILLTVGSLQPHKKILYKDGIYIWARDSLDPYDVHIFLTNASTKDTIVKDASFLPLDYTPVRISGTLGLSHIEGSMWFDKDAVERNGLEYYAYGDYKSLYGDFLNLTQPILIRVGKGGWLALGDEGLWLNNNQLAHDLFMICLHAIWNSNWIPFGWYWDSGCAFYSRRGILNTKDFLETELIPLDIINGKIFLRVIGIAYSSDLNTGIIVERMITYNVKDSLIKIGNYLPD